MSPLLDRLHKIYAEWKTVFWQSMALNLLTYLGYVTYMTYSVDDYGAIFGDAFTFATGRWVIELVHEVLCGKNMMLTFIPVMCMALYATTGVFLCKLWHIGKKHCLLVVSLWSMHPYLLDVYNVRFAALSLALGYLMVVLSLLLAPKRNIYLVLSIILIYCSLSTYQPVLGFAVSAIMVQALLFCTRDRFSKEALADVKNRLFSYAVMLFSAVVLYVVLTKVLFMISGVEVNPRIQAGFINDWEQLKAKLCVVGTILAIRVGPVREFVLPFVGKTALFLIYVLAVWTALGKSPRGWARSAALLWIVLIPLGAVSFMLPLETLDMPWRICLGLVVFAAGMFALTQESDILFVRRAGWGLGVFLLICFVLNNNAIIYKQYLTNQKDLIMGNRIIAKIQSLEDFQPGMELAIVGRIITEDFSKKGKGNLQIVTEYATLCTVQQCSLDRSAFETDWSKYSFLLYYMDLELKYPRPQTIEKATALSRGRKPWPDPSSVFIQDGIVTVILSQPDEKTLTNEND